MLFIYTHSHDEAGTLYYGTDAASETVDDVRGIQPAHWSTTLTMTVYSGFSTSFQRMFARCFACRRLRCSCCVAVRSYRRTSLSNS